ncbi:MAG: DUF3857 domain-containing protein [Ginsengibacter sp.]
MKKQALTFLLILTSLITFAKVELPEYGEIDKKDLLLKGCEFDKDAVAYKLMSSGEVSFKVVDGNFNIITERRVRIKILGDKGLNWANIKIRFTTMAGYELIKNISGITYNLDSSGNILTTKLDKSSIETKRIDDQYSEVSFTLPDVRVGSVFEYKFIDEKKSISNIDDWYFQDDIPTRVSVYSVLIPSMFKFSSNLFASQDVDQESDVVNENAKYRKSTLSYASMLKTYTLENISALKKEPFMGGSPKDYLQKVVYQLSRIDYGDGEKEDLEATWAHLSSTLLANENFGGQLSKKLPHSKKLDEALKFVTDDYKKMTTIHNYVRKNMIWNGNESIYSSDGIKNAWDKKTGNTADLNLILVDLFREAGLKAYPLIASTKDYGTANPKNPFLQQFNVTLAYVIIGDKKYFLNAADGYNPAYLVPSGILNNFGYIVDPEKGGWITMSNSNFNNNHENNTYTNVVSISAKVEPQDTMTGNVTIKSYDYAKNQKQQIWKKGKDTSGFITYYVAGDSTMKIKNIEVAGEDMDSIPLRQKFDFIMPLSSVGNDKSFTLNLFQGFDKNPFIDTDRTTDINFNYKRTFILEGKISIPENYEFNLPKDVEIRMPDSSISMNRELKIDSSALDFKITINFAKPYYKADDYSALQEYYKKLFNALNEQVEIKKKTNT